MAAIAKEEVKRFIVDCLKTAGAPVRAAADQADLLVQADRTGHFSHGLNRLEFYVNDILSGACKPDVEPKILKESPATAWVDGGSALGATVSHFCMDLAIKKAKEVGVGWVTAKASNHFGIAGWWAQKAQREGLIGMAFTNTSPLLAPTRSKQAALGTNPIAVAAPATGGDSFLLDMATTAVAVGKIEIQRRKNEPIPNGWAQGPDGKDTNDAEVGYNTGCLMPLGGSEQTAGYKGFGLAAMVELFCGISSGSRYGHHIRSWSHSGEGGPADLGQCFVAIDPNCFAPGFGDRLADSLQHWRNLERADPSLPVLAPGDKERMNAEATDQKGTITYIQQQIDSCEALAKRLSVKPMQLRKP